MHTIYSENHHLHDTRNLTIEGAPYASDEIPERVEVIHRAILHANLGTVSAPRDFGLPPILAVHSPEYITFLQTIYKEYTSHFGRPDPVLPWSFAPRNSRRKPTHFLGLLGYYGFGTGSPILKGTWPAAYWSAQCALTAADLLHTGEPLVYALCRPPGHHAGRELFGGYCYLNNAAIAARSLGPQTAILDIDFHHGNGTQEIFYQDPTVFYCSIHVHPDIDYPFYWGGEDEIGEGAGLGANRNFPLPMGASDSQYLAVLEQALEAVARFSPRALVLSLGLDFVQDDPVGGFAITQTGLLAIGGRIASLNLPILIVQEGGYLIDQLGENAVLFLRTLM
ncbi:MAG: histone deacetylase family protein [Anaerolineales bacterium]|nr:histone deacetylase family protein [Anaerolineales bacterium]